MKIIKNSHLHIVREVIDFCVVYCNNINFEVFYDDVYSEYCDDIKKIHKEILTNIKLYDNEKKYFKLYKSYSCCLAHLLMYSFTSLDKLFYLDNDNLSFLISEFEKYDLESFPLFFPTINGLSLEDEKQPFVLTVRSLNMSYEEQLEMIYGFYAYEQCICELLNIINRNKEVILKCLGSFEIKNFLKMDDINEDKLELYFTSVLNMDDFNNDNKELTIYPRLCYYDNYVLYRDHFNKDYLLFGIGRKVGFLFKKKSEINKKEIMKFLNILSDDTKMNILQLIKEKPRYGKELADLLNLKTSTISYHMDAMLQINIIKFFKYKKRLYYSINDIEVTNYLSVINNLFR